MRTHSADSPSTSRVRPGVSTAIKPPRTVTSGARTLLAEAPRARTGSAWVLLPLRLFLAVTFVYAGLQKLADPQFFNPSATNYIGKQITGFAIGSPIGGFLLHVVVPHAAVFGALVAYGELAIGLGTLAGLLVRPAAFFGALISLLFFLSASWRVHPYFYGADIGFVFAWLTLVIAGPLAGGWPAFDAVLVHRIMPHIPIRYRDSTARALTLILGTDGALSSPAAGEVEAHSDIRPLAAGLPARAPGARQPQQTRTGRQVHPTRGRVRTQTSATRREFMRGTLAGAASMLGVVFLVSLFRRGDDSAGSSGSVSGAGADATATTSAAGPTVTGATSGAAGAIAQVSSVPVNSAAQFTIPSNGDSGVLVHLSNGQFVAYDAICTHAGCPVQYDPSSQLLICPCHGAEFDPAHQAAVVQGPADTALATVSIHVDNASGNITLG